MNDRPKLAIAMPLYGPIPIPTFRSMIGLISQLPSKFQGTIFTTSSCYINQTRTLIAKGLIEIEKQFPLEYVLWIDSDMEFEMSDVIRLYETMKELKADIITGVYYSRVDGNDPTLQKSLEGQPRLPFYYIPILYRKMKDKDSYGSIPVKEITDPENKELPAKPFKIDSAGFGFILMKFEVLKKIAEMNEVDNVFRYRYASADDKTMGKFIGEDHCFFEDAKKAGYDLWVDPSVVLKHVKAIGI